MFRKIVFMEFRKSCILAYYSSVLLKVISNSNDEVLSPWTRDGAKVKNVTGEVYADMLETLAYP